MVGSCPNLALLFPRITKVVGEHIGLHFGCRCFTLALSELLWLRGRQVLANENPSFGYNAATGVYEDLMAAGIIDPAKVGFESHWSLDVRTLILLV